MAPEQATTFIERQRVLVHWPAQGVSPRAVSYAARVIEIRTEFPRRVLTQTEIRVRYEIDGQQLWHQPSEMEPLSEDAAVPVDDAEDADAIPTSHTTWL